MKLFLRNICFFFIPFILGLIWLFAKPLDREFAYNFLENDCYGHGSWIYERIFHNPTPIDVAFVGASGTIQAIYEEKIESVLSTEYQKELHLANLGYCRPGRNLHYILIKDLLSNKEVSAMVLGVRDDEDRYGHPVFGNLAESADVLAPVAWFNRDIMSDMFKASATRFEYHKRELLLMNPFKYPKDGNPYGYGAGTRVAPKEEMQEMYERRNKPKKELSPFASNFYMSYPRKYIEKIAGICKSNDVKLIFLFLKPYGSPVDSPKELATYQKYGDLWIPPPEIFDKPENWMDPDHLNIQGASELAEWLAEKVKDL